MQWDKHTDINSMNIVKCALSERYSCCALADSACAISVDIATDDDNYFYNMVSVTPVPPTPAPPTPAPPTRK